MPTVLQHDVVLIGLKEIKFKVGEVLTPIKGAMELTIDLQGQTQLVEGDDGVIAYAAEKTYAKLLLLKPFFLLKQEQRCLVIQQLNQGQLQIQY